MALKPVQLTLRCYAEPEKDGTWFAMCVDLNLYARADSFAQVKTRLEGFIADYVREALTDDKAYIGDLFPRKAPLSFRFRYHQIAMMRALHHAKQNMRPRLFDEALPLVPARC